MKLPTHYTDKSEWILLGPMGPELPASLNVFPLLGVDGGAAHASELDLWVGDSDSHIGELKARHVFHHPMQKAHSDLALALNVFERSLPYRLHLWGFLGGRKDHELFNFGEASTFLNRHPGAEIFFYDSSHRICFHFMGKGKWSLKRSGTFSLGCIQKTSVLLTGDCQYPIPALTELAPLSSFGLSNVGRGHLKLECEGAVFIYYPEDE